MPDSPKAQPPKKPSKRKKIQTDRKQVLDKLERYLLNPSHEQGGPKSVFFKNELGYTRNNKSELAKQLTFDEETAQQTEETSYGTKYNQEIEIVSAKNSKEKAVRKKIVTAWIIQKSKKRARIITATPAKKDRKNA